jgi:hypothetical protein
MALHSVQVDMSQLNKYIKNDCKIFDKGTMNMSEYFLNNKIVLIEAPDSSQPNGDEIVPVGVVINKQQQPIEESKSFQTDMSNNNYSKLILADNIIESNKDTELNKLETNNDIVSDLKNKFTVIKPENYLTKVVEVKSFEHAKAMSINIQANEKEDKSENIEINNLIIEEPTVKDYDELTRHEQLMYDRRSFSTYLKEGIINEHRIINILFKKTLFHPFYIKVNKLIFELSMGLALNALMYTANYIDQRATANDKVKLCIS